MKVRELREAIKDMDDEQKLTIRQVQSFVIEPVVEQDASEK